MTAMPGSLWVYRARVERVVDGDTIDVTLDLGLYCYSTQRLRLLGVNAPETKGATRAAGLAAKAFVFGWIHEAEFPSGQEPPEWPIIVQTAKSDAFGRFLAWVWRASDGRSLNDDLIESGHAVPYDE